MQFARAYNKKKCGFKYLNMLSHRIWIYLVYKFTFFGFSAVFSNGFPHFESYCISGVQDSDVVAIAIQKVFDVTADIEELFTTLENLTGLD